MVLLSKSGNFLSAKTVKDGDIVTFLNEGAWEETKFLKDDGNKINAYMIGVTHNGEEKKVKVTAASRDAMASVYGFETKDWIGKQAGITLIPVQNGKSIWLRPIKQSSDVNDIFK